MRKLYFVESATADNYIMITDENGVWCDNCAPWGMWGDVKLHACPADQCKEDEEPRPVEKIVEELKAQCDACTALNGEPWDGEYADEIRKYCEGLRSFEDWEREQMKFEYFNQDAAHLIAEWDYKEN